jgi:hypothetical protein
MGTVLHDRPDYVGRARSLGPVLAAAADEIERNRKLPQAVAAALATALPLVAAAVAWRGRARPDDLHAGGRATRKS